MSKFEIGDLVVHKDFGKGVVTLIKSHFAEVDFHERGLRRINFDYLEIDGEKKKNSVIESLDLVDNENFKIKIYPPDYKENSAISSEQKRIIKSFIDIFSDGKLVMNEIIYYGESTLKYNYYLTSDCFLAFIISPIDEISDLLKQKQVIYLMLESIRNKLVSKFNEINLTNETDAHNIVNINLFLPKLSYIENASIISKNGLNYIYKDFEYYDSLEGIKTIFTKSYLEKFPVSTILESKIFSILSPEYVVIIPDRLEFRRNRTTALIQEKIKADEIEFQTFDLHEEQVKLVNDIKPGHYLFLANAGAGKSVVILSKAIKLAKHNINSKILLTCYNSNLSDVYKFKRDFAGIRSSNLFIMTFHKFIKNYIEDNYGVSLFSSDFDDSMKRSLDFLKQQYISDKIKTKFAAIFIDEVQIFDSEWIDICYMLLEDPKESCVFILAGDLNQDIKNKKKNQKASWQLATLIPEPKFRGRVKYLEINYRNSEPIAKFLNAFVQHYNNQLEKFESAGDSDFRKVVLGESSKPGMNVILKNLDFMDETSEISNMIEKLRKENSLNYSDIAVIFPFKRILKYSFASFLMQSLDKSGIPYNIIYNDDNYSKEKYFNANGVILTTIDSSLGLDFKAVIVAGLHPLDKYRTEGEDGDWVKHMSIQEIIQNKSENQIQFYKQSCNKIYTACSRARDFLIIINSMKNNAISETINYALLQKNGGRNE